MPTPAGIFRLWLDRRIDSNQLAEVEEYTDKLKELVEGVCAAAFVLAILPTASPHRLRGGSFSRARPFALAHRPPSSSKDEIERRVAEAEKGEEHKKKAEAKNNLERTSSLVYSLRKEHHLRREDLGRHCEHCLCHPLSLFIALRPQLHLARERAQGDDVVNEVGVEAAQLAAELLGALPFWSVLRRSRRAACTHLGLLVECVTQRTLYQRDCHARLVAIGPSIGQ